MKYVFHERAPYDPTFIAISAIAFISILVIPVIALEAFLPETLSLRALGSPSYPRRSSHLVWAMCEMCKKTRQKNW
jgi:hypothetical protein